MNRANRAIGIAMLLAAIVAASAGCSEDEDTVEACKRAPINELQELVVVDPGVLSDPRASNAATGPWSFRFAIENMTPRGYDPGEFVRDWLLKWETQTFNGFPLDAPGETRVGGLRRTLLCPWLKGTAENACNDDCSTCAGQKLDLAQAPFRLIAITNRLDLRDEVASEPSGEGRLLFTLTNGPADDPASRPLAMTVIFEYYLPESRSPREWAETWHHLGTFKALDEPYRAALEEVTNSYTRRDSRPEGMNGSALAQLRTNESALHWIWQLRQFNLGRSGELDLGPMRNTPALQFNNSTRLADYINSHSAEILANRYEVPTSMLGASTDAFAISWSAPGVGEPLRKAFATGTCGGCHTTESTAIDNAFHVSPFREGVAKLSRFIHDPNGGADDLSRRAQVMRRILCE
jgi:hypothetical protein